MGFCKFCGAEIPDGGVCNCMGAQNEMNNNMASQQPFAPSNQGGAPYTPDQNYNPYGGGSQPSGGNGVPMDKIKTMVVPIAAGAAAFIVVIVLFSALFGGGYKSPIKKVVKGFNKNNTKMIAQAIVDKDTLEDIEDKVDDWDDADDKLEDIKEMLEPAFGEDIKIKVEFLDKKKAKDKELDKLEDMYDEMDMDVDIKKAYKVKTKLTIKGDDDDVEAKVTLYSVKLKGEGWKVMATEDSLTTLLPAAQKISKKLGLDSGLGGLSGLDLDDLLG